MSTATEIFTKEWTLEAFPPKRTDEFFEAIFGDAEDGAYDIELEFVKADADQLEFRYNLHQRHKQCLACNLTRGLPAVFTRHPIINVKGLAEAAAAALGKGVASWEVGATKEESKALHRIPLYITLA